MAKRIPLVQSGNGYSAEIPQRPHVQTVYVSNAQAERVDGRGPGYFVIIPLSVPRAAEWIVTQEADTVMVSPPEGGLHWAQHTITVVAPRGQQVDVRGNM